MKINVAILITALASLPLAGCGWVDSVGGQDSSISANSEPNQPLIGNDLLFDQGAVLINEAATTRLLLADAPLTASGWTWRALDNNVDNSDALAACNNVENFDSAVALSQLNPACTDASNCNFQFQEIDSNGRTEFDITLPVLTAPTALRFSLEANLDTGERHSQVQTLCVAAINEAPTVNNNRYRAVATQTREVNADSIDAIFSNDSDDEHVRNQPLFIKEVTSAPLYAEDISILSDGSFRYKAFENLDLSEGESLEDEISIIVSDGVHDVESSITVNIVNANVGPTLQLRVPDFTLTPSDRTPASLSESLAQYFNDADGDALQYRIEPNEFTEAGLLNIDENGTLTGTFSMADLGTLPVTVLVSDGLEQIASRFNVIVRDNQVPNREPTVDDIDNERVTGLFSYDVSVFFSDPDGDTLTFSSDDLPPSTNLSNDGLLTGVANDENDGRWFITITASDGRGGTAEDRFRLVIRN